MSFVNKRMGRAGQQCMAGGAVAAVHLSAVEPFFGDFVPQSFAGHKLVSLNVEDTAVVLTNGYPRDQQPFVRF